MESKEIKKLTNLIVGKKVVSGDKTSVTLNDGTVLKVFESEQDCCSSAGGFWIINKENLNAVITDVMFTEDVKNGSVDEYGQGSNVGILSILHNQNTISSAEVYADNGNGGYYLSVVSLRIKLPNSDKDEDFDLLRSP